VASGHLALDPGGCHPPDQGPTLYLLASGNDLGRHGRHGRHGGGRTSELTASVADDTGVRDVVPGVTTSETAVVPWRNHLIIWAKPGGIS
jgi:hypothetical protein